MNGCIEGKRWRVVGVYTNECLDGSPTHYHRSRSIAAICSVYGAERKRTNAALPPIAYCIVGSVETTDDRTVTQVTAFACSQPNDAFAPGAFDACLYHRLGCMDELLLRRQFSSCLY